MATWGLKLQLSKPKSVRRSETTTRTTIRSIFGSHCFEQFTYAPAAKKATQLLPISARMLLPKRQWSYLLQEFSQKLAIDQSYEHSMNSLAIHAAESIKSISADLAKMLTQTVHRKPRTQEMDYCTNSWKRHLGENKGVTV